MIYFKDEYSDIKLENGEYTINFIDDKEVTVFYVAAVNDKLELSDGISGTVTISVSPFLGQWHSVASEGDTVVDLTLCGHNAGYTPAVFLTHASSAKVVVSGLSFGNYVSVAAWRK